MKKLLGFFLWVCLLGSYGRFDAQTLVISCPDTFQSVFASDNLVCRFEPVSDDSVLALRTHFKSYFKVSMGDVNWQLVPFHGLEESEYDETEVLLFHKNGAVCRQVLEFFAVFWEKTPIEREAIFQGGNATIEWVAFSFVSGHLDTIRSKPRTVYLPSISSEDRKAFNYLLMYKDSIEELGQLMNFDASPITSLSKEVLKHLSEQFPDSTIGLIAKCYYTSMLVADAPDQLSPELKHQVDLVVALLNSSDIPIVRIMSRFLGEISEE